MSQGLAEKTAHLIGDFAAIFSLVTAIEHELEKRLIARHGLTKLESLLPIAAAYKNELKRSGANPQKIAAIEDILARLRADVDGGIRDIRNAMQGHLLKLGIAEIPEYWLFLGHSSFKIILDELQSLDSALADADPTGYRKAAIPPKVPRKIIGILGRDLGVPGTARVAHIRVGIWTPDIVGLVPMGSEAQDATVMVFGLRLTLRQIGLVMRRFLHQAPKSVFSRLLHEIALIDFFALEEAIFDGNLKGSTLSLVDEWKKQSHKGVPRLLTMRGSLATKRQQWKDDIRNKVCAHMDANVGIDMLDMANWPIKWGEFDQEVEKLCGLLGEAGKLEVWTKFFTAPADPQNDTRTIDTGVPRWSET